ncbi:hypothetical protein ABT033_30990 [Streptomyces pharetrae]|uniref:hypothetical protein n=1 Tax=Streptomyces pharetrae TaxID=291370 RepID=UPI003352EA32
MGRKKSGRLAADEFRKSTAELRAFTAEVDGAGLSPTATNVAYDAALIKTSVAFEKLMLECLIVAVNSDSGPLSKSTDIAFPKHMTVSHCEYLITAGGYFDFKGRGALLKDMLKYTGKPHWLYDVVSDGRYYHSLELLLALRNFAAHESPQAKKKMKREIFCYRRKVKDPNSTFALKADFAKAYAPTSAGSWAKKQQRFDALLNELDHIAGRIHAAAPY